MIVDSVEQALQSLDWKYITLSPYLDNIYKVPWNHLLPVLFNVWQERVVAYELYHQLRLIWSANPDLQKRCIIQAEVRKGYQQILKLDKMPDFIFHQRIPGANHTVVEIKLASRPAKQVRADFTKLALFQRDLGYQELIQVLIGKDKEFASLLSAFRGKQGYKTTVLCLSTETKRVSPAKVFWKIPATLPQRSSKPWRDRSWTRS